MDPSPQQSWIIGNGGHAKVVASVWKELGGKVDGYVVREGGGGHLEVLEGEFIEKSEALSYGLLLGIGSVRAAEERLAAAERLERLGGCFHTVVSPRAIIGEGRSLGTGSVILAGAIVAPGVRMGKFCIVNHGGIVDHDSILEDGVHVAGGAVVCGNTLVGKASFIGAGAVIIQGVTIGVGVTIGAGAVVTKSVRDNAVVVGVPAREIHRQV